MIIVLLGASGSGKSIIEHEMITHYGFSKIVPYTTRKPRESEVNGKDYYFTNNETFTDMLREGLFTTYDEYPGNRLYGTLKSDYVDGNKIVVLTPNGLRQLKKSCVDSDNVFTVLVYANLGTRVKRYIDRCGVDKFTFDDKNEISSRVDRDFGMFLGIEKEVDFVIYNNEGTNIDDLTVAILEAIERKGEV